MTSEYIKKYCEVRGLKFQSLDDCTTFPSGCPKLLLSLPLKIGVEIDLVPIIEVVLNDEDIDKIIVTATDNLMIWRKK